MSHCLAANKTNALWLYFDELFWHSENSLMCFSSSSVGSKRANKELDFG